MAIDCGPSSRPTRRTLLKYVPAAFSAVTLARPGWTDSKPELNFPTEARSRLAVTSYPFRALIESPANRDRDSKVPGMDLKDFPAFVAAKFGIYNVNPLVNHFSSTDQAYVDAFRVALVKAKSHIVDLGLPGGRFYATDAAVRRSAVSTGQKNIDIAAQVGSPSVRQHVSGHAGEKPDIRLAVESLGTLAEYGAKRNVVINLENDSLISEDPFFLIAVIEKVNSPYLRALPDFGNSLIGHDPEYNQRAVKEMLMHAFNMCHVKDTVEGSGGKRLKVDLGSLFGLAKAMSYRGYFSMEFDTSAGDPVGGTKQLVEETLQHLS